MPIKKLKKTGNARREMSVLTYEEITTNKPFKGLLKARKEYAGRNNRGVITVRHRGSGNKTQLRDVDFDQRAKMNIDGIVKTVEYDPNRSAFIMLVSYKDGDYRYHLAPEGIQVGDKILTAKKTKAKIGNRMILENIPVGFDIHNVQTDLNGKGQLVKSAGGAAKLVSLEGEYAQVELPSGEVRFVHKACFASIGRVSNIEHGNISIGKAGRSRWMGRRPEVRGKVMNPCDHPHGGGEGNCPIGLKYPKTPWGLHALGVATRRRKYTNRWIVKTRKGKMLAELNNL
jgi:large subunit ribosomal protein L2